MTFVAINVLAVPEGAGSKLEERFSGRAGAVDRAPGFLSFELLRPLSGSSDYMVVTHWRSQQDFQDWTASQSFRHGHASAAGRPSDRAPTASGSEIMTFEVAQRSGGVTDKSD